MVDVPPLLDPRVVEFDNDTMSPTWRQFWVKLLKYITGAPNGVNLAASPSYADDVAAAVGGVPIGGFYRNQTAPGVSVIQVRTS